MKAKVGSCDQRLGCTPDSDHMLMSADIPVMLLAVQHGIGVSRLDFRAHVGCSDRVKESYKR